MIEIADVDGPRRLGARLLERELKQTRIRLLHTPFVRIEDVVEPLGEIDAIEQVLETPVRVRDDDQPQAAVLQRGQGRQHIGLDVLPQVVVPVILAQLDEGRIGGVVLRDAGVLQHEVEIEPAARAVVRAADRMGIVDIARRLLLGGGQRRRGDLGAMTHHRIGDTRPRWMADHPTGIEKYCFNRL